MLDQHKPLQSALELIQSTTQKRLHAETKDLLYRGSEGKTITPRAYVRMDQDMAVFDLEGKMLTTFGNLIDKRFRMDVTLNEISSRQCICQRGEQGLNTSEGTRTQSGTRP